MSLGILALAVALAMVVFWAVRVALPDPAQVKQQPNPARPRYGEVYVVDDDTAAELRANGLNAKKLGIAGLYLVHLPSPVETIGDGTAAHRVLTAPNGARFVARPINPADHDLLWRIALADAPR